MALTRASEEVVRERLELKGNWFARCDVPWKRVSVHPDVENRSLRHCVMFNDALSTGRDEVDRSK